MLHRIRYWLRAVFRHSALDRELQEEMQIHLDRRIESLIGEGVTPDEARLAARREFGNPTVLRDSARDATKTAWIDSIGADIRFALRYFAHKPLSAATIILVLALGIGGSTFQVSTLLSLTSRAPDGIPGDRSLVRLRGMYREKDAPRWKDRTLWYAEVRGVSEIPNTFEAVAAWTTNRVVANTSGTPGDATLWAQFVTRDFFKVIGARVSNGPGLPDSDTDVDAHPAGVISYGLWEDMFDRGDVTGKVVTLNGTAVRIVGVAPPKFTGALPVDNRRMMWLPLSSRRTVLGLAASSPAANLDSGDFQAVGRLRPGVTPQHASAAAHVVSARVVSLMVRPAASIARARIQNVFDADVVPLRGITSLNSDLPLLFAAWAVLATLVMAVICTNVSGLVIGASVSRRHEIAIRLSLGASRARVIRQLLTESVLLALAAAVLGFIVYLGIITAASRVPEIRFVQADLPTFGLTMLVALGTGILFGLAPAFHATRLGVGEVLKSGSAGTTSRSRLHQSFVVAQVALIQPLLVLIAAMITSVKAPDRVTLPNGIPERVVRLSLDVDAMPGTHVEKAAAVTRLAERLRRTPGVVTVLPSPTQAQTATLAVRKEDRGSLGRASDPIPVDMMLSTVGYFDLIGVPLLRGTDAPPADSGWTTVISSDLAHALWGESDPIGKRFQQTVPGLPAPHDLVVTGVYDSRHLESGKTSARIYRPVKNWTAFAYLIRTAGPAAAFTDSIGRIAREELPTTPIDRPVTFAQIDAEAMRGDRTGQLAVTGIISLVLLLASIGLYGIVALSVGQRRREIGVRMALGARSGQVVGLFYRSGLKLGVLGLTIGLPISLVATRVLPALDEQAGTTNVGPPNLWIIGPSVATIVLVVASIATLLPATRAATVNPVTALRTD
jgi:predicted permease